MQNLKEAFIRLQAKFINATITLDQMLLNPVLCTKIAVSNEDFLGLDERGFLYTLNCKTGKLKIRYEVIDAAS